MNAAADARRGAGLSRAQRLAARKQLLLLRSGELRASIARDCQGIARDVAPALALVAQARTAWHWLHRNGPLLAVGLGVLKILRPARARPARRPARLKRWWRKAKLAALAGTVAWQALGRRGRR